MRPTTLLLGLAAVALVGGGIYVATRPATAAASTTPSHKPISVDACVAILKGLSPDVATGAWRAALTAGPDPDAMRTAYATYLETHGMPNAGSCLRANPQVWSFAPNVPSSASGVNPGAAPPPSSSSSSSSSVIFPPDNPTSPGYGYAGGPMTKSTLGVGVGTGGSSSAFVTTPTPTSPGLATGGTKMAIVPITTFVDPTQQQTWDQVQKVVNLYNQGIATKGGYALSRYLNDALSFLGTSGDANDVRARQVDALRRAMQTIVSPPYAQDVQDALCTLPLISRFLDAAHADTYPLCIRVVP